jgi:hypothetical protein
MRQQLVRRVGQFGHGWLPFIGMDTPLAPFKPEIEQLKQALRDNGRDPSRFEVSVRFRTSGRSIEQAFEEDMPVMHVAGITQTYVPLLSIVPDLDAAPAFIRQLGRVADRHRL